MRKATIGAVSSGTMQTEDLLERFADELAWLTDAGRTEHETDLLFDVKVLFETGDTNGLRAADLVDELADALNEHALPYTYFGASPGDGANYGFWPDWDAINELPFVNNGDEAKELGMECRFVNDHGNITIFNDDGSVLWDCV